MIKKHFNKTSNSLDLFGGFREIRLHHHDEELVTHRIEVMENIHDANGKIADKVNRNLQSHGNYCVNVMGAPGVGKTSSLLKIIENLKTFKASVIEGDIESDIDTVRMQNAGIPTFQINTGGACHLDAPLIEKALESFDLPDDSMVFIENIGNLVCPAEFMIGEDIKLLISTTTEGSDKPYKYPLAFERADIILINKIDLLDYVDFDEDFYMRGVRALNRLVPVFKVSARTGEGFREVAEWLENKAGRNEH